MYLGGNNYRPSYRNYGWYNGYWSPNRTTVGYRGGYRDGYRVGGYNGFGIGGFGLGLGGYGLGYGLGTGVGYPLGWGLGGWGLGRNYYTSGYLPYSNPYYSGGVASVYDYSQPVPVATDRNNGAADQAAEDFEEARQQFLAGEYNTALALVDRALKVHPSDAVLHEFRGVILFAQGDYQSSAATLHSVLAVGPGWDWPTMIGLYPDVETYTSQLRTLEANAKANPDNAAPRFVLAYLYISSGHQEAAARQLREVTRLMPNDRTAADLLRMVDRRDEGARPESPTPRPSEPAPTDAVPSAPPIAAAALAGTWHAARDDGSKFDLALAPDKNFVWTYSQDDREQELSGTYSTEGSLLILQPEKAGSMIGQVKMEDKDSFNFRLMGAPPDDKGLDFSR